jgi:hypothetical protein
VSAAPQLSSTPTGAVSRGKLAENLMLKMPYKFEKSYGGTPEPQTPQDAPCWLHGPSLKRLNLLPCSVDLVDMQLDKINNNL